MHQGAHGQSFDETVSWLFGSMEDFDTRELEFTRKKHPNDLSHAHKTPQAVSFVLRSIVVMSHRVEVPVLLNERLFISIRKSRFHSHLAGS